MNWTNSINAFINIAKYENFSEAARRTYSSPSALSKKLAWLEEQLGVDLFYRSTRRVSLTREGQQFLRRASAWVDELQSMQDMLADNHKAINGNITLTASIAFGEQFMTPYIVEFMQKHPLVCIRPLYSNEYINMELNNIDIAVRTDSSYDDGSKKTYIGDVRRGMYAHKSYIKKHGMPKKPEDLMKHNCLVYKASNATFLWEFKDNITIAVPSNFESNNISAITQACLGGVGIMQSTEHRVKDHLKSGELVAVLGDYCKQSWRVYIHSVKTVYPKKRVQVFTDGLIDYLRTTEIIQYERD